MIFSTALLVIQAQPYNDYELRELLLPEGCSEPCFMGIRPGVTTKDEALRLLKATGWFAYYNDMTELSLIIFTWTQNHSTLLVSEYAYSGTMYLNNNFVNQLVVETHLRLGDFQLGLGKPAFQYSAFIKAGSIRRLLYTASYPNEQVTLNVKFDCVTHKRKIRYFDTVILSYDSTTMLPSTTQTWSDVIRRSCP